MPPTTAYHAQLPNEAPLLSCQIHYRTHNAPIPLAAVTEFYSGKEHPSIIGGNEAPCDANRFSAWAAEPKEIFRFQANDNKPFEKLQQVLNKYKLTTGPLGLPKSIFTCGWIGWLSYELGQFIEKLPQTATDDLGLPLIRLCFYDRTICYDHHENRFYLIALSIQDDPESPEQKLDMLQDNLSRAAEQVVPRVPDGDMQSIDAGNLRCNMAKDYYFDALEKIHNHIYDGDVYQINFSQRFDCDYSARPIDLYHWQNKHNPSPYAAFIKADDCSIVSASPEMFITVTDGCISTKPIKGTRPRFTTGPNADKLNKANFVDLVESKKEQAELNMIVDLERNDLARICKPGTRKVTQPRTIEEYPTVYHAVATIAGELKDPDSDSVFCNIIKAIFPGGSITGAPKIRSMEIIDQLEPTQRSVYTGSIGFIGIDRNICLNIAIRTIIVKDSMAYVQTGGGIVADSNPQSEWDETITKARALIAGINAVQNAGRTETE